jgi:hypothetical protein
LYDSSIKSLVVVVIIVVKMKNLHWKKYNWSKRKRAFLHEQNLLIMQERKEEISHTSNFFNVMITSNNALTFPSIIFCIEWKRPEFFFINSR